MKPTAEMAKIAKRALSWRAEYGRGGTSVGVARARDIANRKNLSDDTVNRMHQFFARHAVDKRATGFRYGEPGFPSAGRIAWDLWGGDAGRKWAMSKRTKPLGGDTRMRNPVGRKRKLAAAAKLYENFTGHQARYVERVLIDVPQVLLLVGECDGVLYSCVRDGQHERYIHQFKKQSRPLLCSNETGTALYLIGGEYNFTSRGIVDKRPRKA